MSEFGDDSRNVQCEDLVCARSKRKRDVIRNLLAKPHPMHIRKPLVGFSNACHAMVHAVRICSLCPSEKEFHGETWTTMKRVTRL
jgi:hypothetical protein